MQHIFIIGSKGIPARYGGYETFTEQLTKGKKAANLEYHVVCKSNETFSRSNQFFTYNDAECIRIHVPKLGPGQAIYYDLAALNKTISLVKQRKIQKPIFYILACRIGPFMKFYVNKIHELGGQVFINPDGHEWKRAKWSRPVKAYLKLCEELMVKHADLVVCDSIGIQNYIDETYQRFSPQTTFIAYGADSTKSQVTDTDPLITDWLGHNQLSKKEFYLVVGRFVPENNYETIIKEFMRSNTSKDLVLITNVSKNKFYEQLKLKTHFERDSRIKFVGTVYNQKLLKKIRELAFGYIHGHSVGGTNPSLLEALASTQLNLLFDVNFNREVARKSALYWTRGRGDLCRLLNRMENLSSDELQNLDHASTCEVVERYSWDKIVGQYEQLFSKQ